MVKLFELACFPEMEDDWMEFHRLARESGWIITGVQSFMTDRLYNGDDDVHRRFLCDHDWRDARALVQERAHEGFEFALRVARTVMPMNIYDGQQRYSYDGIRNNDEYYYDHTIPKVQFAHGGDIIWSLPLDAMIPPLSGKELKEHALQNDMTSLTYLSGEPLKDEDLIIAPSIDRRLVYHSMFFRGNPECPGHVIFNCERVRKTRLRGKQNAMNLYKPY